MFRSRFGKIGLTVAAVALLALAFVALRPTDETDDQATTPAAVTSASGTTSVTVPTRTATTPARTTVEPEPEPAEVVPILRTGQTKTIKANKGDTVRFAVENTGDAAQEVHIHGYDRYLDVEPGKTVTESFKADAEGGFEIELHGSGEQIGTLEVSPG